MKLIGKTKKLEHVAYDVRGPVVAEADRMIEQGKKIMKLNIGNPAPFGFEAPDEIIRDMMANLHLSEGYSDSKGIFSARKAIMQYCQLKNMPNVGINDIYTGNYGRDAIGFENGFKNLCFFIRMNGYRNQFISLV